MYEEFSFYDLNINLEIEIVHDYGKGCIYNFQLAKKKKQNKNKTLIPGAVLKLKFLCALNPTPMP